MDYQGRRNLRQELLQQLYDYHFLNQGADCKIDKERTDIEELLAYQYLNDKGLIAFKQLNHDEIDAKITSWGIDNVENNLENERNVF
jgi:hypothetical protein